MDISFFEKILIKFLYIDKEVREKTLPFLDPKIFDDKKHINIIKHTLDYNEKFERFPSIPEMKIDIADEESFERLKEIINIDISEYKNEFLLESIEEFIKFKLVNNINVDIAVNLHNNDIEKLSKFPDLLRETLAFSFNSQIGLDFLEEGENLFSFLHDKDNIIKSPIKVLNKLMDGGFHEKTLNLFLAPPNKGKSLIMSSIMCDMLLQNKNVLYITLEMSEKKISQRLLANLWDIDIRDLKSIPKDKFLNKIAKLKNQISKKMIIKEFPTSSINVNHIRNLLKDLEVRKKFIPDIVFVDYLGIMLPSHRNKVDNTYVEVKRISEELRALAVEKEIPFISAIQVNRQGSNKVELDMEDIADSFGIAATADTVIGVSQNEELRSQGKYLWTIIKNRDGINGIKFSVLVDYYKMRVSDDPECELNGTSESISTEKNNPKEEAINEVNNFLKKDFENKKNKVIQFE